MKDEKLHQAEWQTGQEPAQKQPYEPPRATFVPLKLEERLLECKKNGTPWCTEGDRYSS